MNDKEWLIELKTCIIGSWDNKDYSFIFNSYAFELYDGAFTMHHKPTNTNFGANYGIKIRDGMAICAVRAGSVFPKVCCELFISFKNSDSLHISNVEGFSSYLDRVA